MVEVKVLSGLGRDQLSRYRAALPDVPVRVAVFPERLSLDVGQQTGWQPVTWESLLAAFSTSANSWVSETATAWQRHLDAAMPAVGDSGGTR